MGTLYIKPVGGLANRIRVINSALSLASAADKSLCVVWEMNPDLNARFSELFEKSDAFDLIEQRPGLHLNGVAISYFPDKTPQGLQAMIFRLMRIQRNISSIVWYNQLDEIFADLRMEYDPSINPTQQDILDKAMPRISAQCSDLGETSGSAYASSSWNIGPERDLMFDLKPNAKIQSALAKLPITTAKTVGLHIRRSDHSWSIEHSSDEAFIRIISTELEKDGSTRFFLATDSTEVAAKLEGLFPDKILRYKHESMARNSSTGIESAVIDLFGLSMCRKVYGSFLSTFSELAAKIGRIESHTAL